MSLMQVNPSISFAICVSEETESFIELVDFINLHKKEKDEIIVISDFSKCERIKEYLETKVDKYIYRKLLYDFASHKNIFFSICNGDYIFNLDSDELPSETLIKEVHSIILKHQCDLFWLPRLNYFDGVDEKTAKHWGWSIDKDKNNAINFPDYQGRIYKNNNKLRWNKKLHEQIVGATSRIQLKYTDDYYLRHTKSIDDQANSNRLYKELTNYNPPQSDIGVVCCYFNPCDYKSKFLNFSKFLSEIRSTNIEPLVVESYTENSKYRVNKLTKNCISIKTESVFWMKEQLLNVGIKRLLVKNYKYIMWIDADIKFNKIDWWKDVILATEFYGVAQIFSNSKKENVKSENKEKNSSAYKLTHCNKKNDTHILLDRKGEPGYGCCYHRSFLEKNLLFDLAVVGGGDLLNLIGFYYCKETHDIILRDRFFKNTTYDFKIEFINWCKRNKKIKNGVGYANLDIDVMFHGNEVNRRYINREKILKQCEFTPTTDIELNNGIYLIKNKSLEQKLKEYFINRKEDEKLSKKNNEEVTKIYKDNSYVNCNFSVNKEITTLEKFTTKQCLSKFKITDSDIVLVGARIKNELFSLKNFGISCNVLVDGGVDVCLNSFTHKPTYSSFGIFLSFIVTHYNSLPNYVVFANNEKQKNIASKISKSSILNSNSFCVIDGVLSKTNISPHLKIKNHNTIRNYYRQTLNQIYTEDTTKYTGTCFSVPRKCVYRKPKMFYSKILKQYEKNPDKEEHFLRLSFYNLFK